MGRHISDHHRLEETVEHAIDPDVYSGIGYPGGRDLVISFQDNELLGHEGPPNGKPPITAQNRWPIFDARGYNMKPCRVLALAASVVALAVAMSSCAQKLPQAEVAASQPQVKFEDFDYTQEECKSKDGWWGYEGLRRDYQKDFCHLPSPDAGKACQSSKDCLTHLCFRSTTAESTSRKVEGRCSKYQISAGCIARLEDGIEQQAICMD